MNSDEKCTLCGVTIYDVSVFRDTSLCSNCRRRAVEDSSPVRMPAPVTGTWYEQLPDGFRLGSNTRSWKSIASVSVLVLFGAAGWRQGLPRDPLGLLFLTFGISTLLVQSLLGLLGSVRLTREGSRFTVFTGIGLLGRERVFEWSDITSVHEHAVPVAEGSAEPEIVLVGASRIRFGRLLSDERRYFVREVLRLELKRGRA